MFRYFSSWSALAVSTRPVQLPKLFNALTIAQRSAAQNGQKPAPMKNTIDLPLCLFNGSSVTCINLPSTFFGMKSVTDRVFVVYFINVLNPVRIWQHAHCIMLASGNKRAQ